MKHLLTKNQIALIETQTEFRVRKTFDMYELAYKKSRFKTLRIFLRTDSRYDDRPIFQQLKDYCDNYNPDSEAAKRYLAFETPRLAEILTYTEQVKKDLNKLEKVVLG